MKVRVVSYLPPALRRCGHYAGSQRPEGPPLGLQLLYIYSKTLSTSRLCTRKGVSGVRLAPEGTREELTRTPIAMISLLAILLYANPSQLLF